MAIATINPATGKTEKTFTPLADGQIEEKLRLAVETSRPTARFRLPGARA